ncbi:MAG: SAM-dependent chlorinase/fluorinase [Planctomycetota bacterium]
MTSGAAGCGTITLLTDFGARDVYAGVMKGVILRALPGATVVDLTHGVPPQDVMAGALALEGAFPYFPDGTVHVAVVDPGVGGPRRIIAARARSRRPSSVRAERASSRSRTKRSPGRRQRRSRRGRGRA